MMNLNRIIGWFKRKFSAEHIVLAEDEISTAEPIENTVDETPAEQKTRATLYRLQKYMFENYDFRFNVLTEQAEWRAKHEEGAEWMIVDKRTLNTFVLEASDHKVNCWDRDMTRLLHSRYVVDYHPMKDYMAGLPEWDGVDRVSRLARRVSHDALWVNGFHRWMLGVAAQWMGMDMQCANAIAPVIISPVQGLGKSTFCRMLLPKALTPYYIDRFDVTAQSGYEQKLATCALINMDEFDRYSPAQMASLKNVMQMMTSFFRKMRSSHMVNLHRTASFIATTNRREILTDESGSRRFICVEAEGQIDRSPIDHDQLYAQLRHELTHGERYWLTQDEEKELQAHNKQYYRIPPAVEVFWKCFRLPSEDETCPGLGITEIFAKLKKSFPAIMRDVKVNSLAQYLVALGAQKQHRRDGNVYMVLPVTSK